MNPVRTQKPTIVNLNVEACTHVQPFNLVQELSEVLTG